MIDHASQTISTWLLRHRADIKTPQRADSLDPRKMRPVILASLFAIAVMAIPVAHEMHRTKHLAKRDGGDELFAITFQALLAFGGFILGGNIIAKKAINYYFNKKGAYDEESLKKNLLAAARVKNIGAKPQPFEQRLVEEVYMPL
jgi:hypothetical protein